ncbi:hypothetical protein [Dongshaea marina]|uniref:hypothetical protein n=1 Tax=Dongshaea marina TaxID=2047966 RepID=UPI000D3E7067|nr:hypothetical protein [Dongshaea marina]
MEWDIHRRDKGFAFRLSDANDDKSRFNRGDLIELTKANNHLTVVVKVLNKQGNIFEGKVVRFDNGRDLTTGEITYPFELNSGQARRAQRSWDDLLGIVPYERVWFQTEHIKDHHDTMSLIEL